MLDPDVGVYVHVPFCERICPYCDFAVVARRSLAPEEEAGYVDAIRGEITRRRGAFAGRRLATVYFGGGTPALLTPRSLASLLAALREAFPGPAPEEVTLEANPSTVERERLPDFRAAGVDRISLGVQSFDDETLRRLGRAHRAEAAHRTIEACREAGFASLSLDLIFAAPHQSESSAGRDLEAAIAHSAEHLSLYELTVEAGTPFELARDRGQLPRAGEEEVVAMLQRAEARLEAAGYRRYELSNYARPGHEARHNRRYWQRLPVLGLGVGAFSTDPPSPSHPFGTRRSNPRSLAAYLAGSARGAPPATEVLDERVARREAVFLSLRTAEGLDAARFADEFGAPPRQAYAEEIDALCRAGLLDEAAGGDLRLTPRGRLLADTVFSHFV